MLTEKDYCDYETCVALKELGYNRGAYAYYFPNHKEGLVFNTYPMRDCSINEMVRNYNTYTTGPMGFKLIDAPTLYEAQKWLREEKRIEIVVHSFDYAGEPYSADIHMYRGVRSACSYAESYEEALSTAIGMAVEYLKEK